MALHLHRSNRTEALVDALADLVRAPLADPLTPECIVVQGRGMERWLSMQLAERLGAWANPSFPFPRRLVAQLLARFLGPDPARTDVFDLPALGWAVAALLPTHLDDPAFAAVRRYVGDNASGLRLAELAERIATTFDRYLVYRPDLIRAWEDGRDTDWQALLWRAVVARHGNAHVAARALALTEQRAHRAAGPPPEGVPARICLFGVSSLPPLYLAVLSTVARLVDVHLFVLSPSREYWGDVRSPREIERARERAGGIAQPGVADPLHLTEGHPLVASLGRLGRDFLQLIEEAGGYVETPHSLYVEPEPGSMLGTLQADMLALEHAPHALAPDDDSITIHACHGPMREVEVLHDQLLALFDADPSLQPHEVLVMSPAIEVYAPYIEAVFGSGHDGRPSFGYRVVDRGARATDVTYDAFCRLLDVLGGRVTASEVVDLLEITPIREHAGLAPADLEVVRRWIHDAGIRWGIDEDHRASVGYPPIRETTWRFGLDRLLLGCALRSPDGALFGGVLPFETIDASERATLGKIAAFCEHLFALRAHLRAPRPLATWAHDLHAAVDALGGPGAASALLPLRRALGAVGSGAAAVGYHAPVGLEVARLSVDHGLRERASPLGFLGGGLTFCAMVPMRSIPFRVVVLLGMNDDAFPRVERPLGFDRAADEHRLGDRSSRDDDRYTFLEALLSARERLIITYVGQSIRDNASLPPSVVVSELLDALDASFTPPPDTTVRAHVEVHHRLQAFSPAYFRPDDSRLFSYARDACAGATRLLAAAAPAPLLLPEPLPPRATLPLECTIEAFARFLEHPIRGFLSQQLGLFLGSDLMVLEDREPVTLEPLDEWSIGDDLLERVVTDAAPADPLATVRAAGTLPPGNLGALHLAEILPRVATIAAHVAALRAGPPLAPLDVDLRLGDVRLRGVLDGLWSPAQVRHQYSKLGRRSELRMWIHHLLLLLIAAPGYPRTTIIVGRDAERRPARCRFGAVAAPETELVRLADLFVAGQCHPLVCFPNASRKYAEVLATRPDAHDQALAQARTVYGDAESRRYADCQDPYVRQVWADRDPFAAEGSFESTALTIFRPLLRHRELDA